MDFRRTINVSFNVNELEHSLLQWLSTRQARNESETLRELLRKAGDEAGFFSTFARAEHDKKAKAEPAGAVG